MYFNLDRYTEGTGTEIERGTSTGDVIDEIGIEEAEWSLGRPLLDAVTRMDVEGAESVPLGDVTATYYDFEGRSLIAGDFEAADIEERLTSVGGVDAVEPSEESEWTIARFPQPEDGEHVIGFGNEVNIAFSDGMAVTPAIDDGDGVGDVLVDDEDESLLGVPGAADVADALDDVEAYSRTFSRATTATPRTTPTWLRHGTSGDWRPRWSTTSRRYTSPWRTRARTTHPRTRSPSPAWWTTGPSARAMWRSRPTAR